MVLAVEKMFERENRKIFRQGKKEGIKEGIKKTYIDLAIKMLKENVDIDFISRITEIDKDEIEKLNKSTK